MSLFAGLSLIGTSAFADIRVSGSIAIGGEPKAVSAPATGGRTKGPPPWAPAHGRRAKHSYQYFAAQEVYYRPSDGVWFYMDGGRWSAGARLPSGISVNLSSGVQLAMDSDKPYAFHTAVKQAHPKKGDGNAHQRVAEPEPPKSHGNGKGKGGKRMKN